MYFKKLRELRLNNNLTTNDMASLLDISKPFYSQIETKNRRLSYDMATKISRIFGLKPDDIFFEEFFNKKETEK